MAKLKPQWVKTDIPKELKIKLWKVMKDNPTHSTFLGYLNKHKTEFPDEQMQYSPLSPQTYKKLKDELLEMPKEEVDTLPLELQVWLVGIRQDLIKTDVTEGSLQVAVSSILLGHFIKVAETAKIFAHRVERLLHYKDIANMQGNILVGVSLTRKTDGQVLPDWQKERRYDEEHKVNPYLAKCLLNHYEDKFGKLPNPSWEAVTIKNVNKELLDNLLLLTHTEQLKICPDCPGCQACKDMKV